MFPNLKIWGYIIFLKCFQKNLVVMQPFPFVYVNIGIFS